MLRDNKLSLADGLAYDGTGSVVDLGGTNRALGQPVKVIVEGHGLTAVTAVVLLDGTTSSPATTRATYAITAAALNAGRFEFYLPSNTQRYIKLSLTGATTGGTWDAFIAIGGQTAN